MSGEPDFVIPNALTHLNTLPNTSEEFRELITGLIRMENERYEKILEALGDMRYTIRTIDKRLKKQAAIEKKEKKRVKQEIKQREEAAKQMMGERNLSAEM